ncbi:hypothetical protein [Gimesia sp.]
MAETNASDVGKLFALEAGGGIALGFVLGQRCWQGSCLLARW